MTYEECRLTIGLRSFLFLAFLLFLKIIYYLCPEYKVTKHVKREENSYSAHFAYDVCGSVIVGGMVLWRCFSHGARTQFLGYRRPTDGIPAQSGIWRFVVCWTYAGNAVPPPMVGRIAFRRDDNMEHMVPRLWHALECKVAMDAVSASRCFLVMACV